MALGITKEKPMLTRKITALSFALVFLVSSVALALGFPTATRTAMVQAILDDIDAGAAAGSVRIYNGTQPATCGTATTLLAEATLNDPAGTVASGVLTLDIDPAVTDSSANATGTASWFRIVDSDGNCAVDGTVTATGGGGDLTLSSTSITSGGTVTITSFTITAPNA